jgi:hypothetical protein
MKKIIFIIVAFFLVRYIYNQVSSFEQSLEIYQGNFNNDEIDLTVNAEDNQRYGFIKDEAGIGPINAMQTAPGQIEGTIQKGEQTKKFTLYQGLWQAVLPEQYRFVDLNYNGHSYHLKRITDKPEDFTGKWRGYSHSAELYVEKGEKGIWQALFILPTQNVRHLIQFNVSGSKIVGQYRDTQRGHIAGNANKQSRLTLTVEGVDYEFSRYEDIGFAKARAKKFSSLLDFSSLVTVFDGIYKSDDASLSIVHRQHPDRSKSGIIDTCDGRLKYKEIDELMLSCGKTADRIWFQYRNGNNFAKAFITSAENGVVLTLPNKTNILMQRIHKPLVVGIYKTKNGTSLEFSDYKNRIWSGSVTLNDNVYPFKGHFAANKLEAVSLQEGNVKHFEIVSNITTGQITWAGGEVESLFLTYKSPFQPHSAKELDIIAQAYSYYQNQNQ